MNSISSVIKAASTVVVDVRTPVEFMGGHVAGSINIPLNELPQRLDELKQMGYIVFCCASGGRSGQATAFSKQHGIACSNGGSWIDVNYHKNN
jgi:rhodanese-related sulfurtransferase